MHLESKKYFSNKHKMYGYKTKVSVLPNGIAFACSDHDPGLESDLALFPSMAHLHRRATRKNEHGNRTPDHDPLRTLYPMNWAVLTGKGYKPPHSRLSLDDERGNAELSSDRMIVENFFGRQYSLLAIIGSKLRWSESFQFSVAPNNLHIVWHALREGYGIFLH